MLLCCNMKQVQVPAPRTLSRVGRLVSVLMSDLNPEEILRFPQKPWHRNGSPYENGLLPSIQLVKTPNFGKSAVTEGVQQASKQPFHRHRCKNFTWKSDLSASFQWNRMSRKRPIPLSPVDNLLATMRALGLIWFIGPVCLFSPPLVPSVPALSIWVQQICIICPVNRTIRFGRAYQRTVHRRKRRISSWMVEFMRIEPGLSSSVSRVMQFFTRTLSFHRFDHCLITNM